MKIKKWSLIAGALVLAASLAHGETAKMPSRSVGPRTAACSWIAAPATSMELTESTAHPTQSSNPLKGGSCFAECVQLCLDPLPSIYAQKPFIEGGGSWFGKTKSDCLSCHAVGSPKGMARY